jgi:predicted RecB family nuclease
VGKTRVLGVWTDSRDGTSYEGLGPEDQRGGLWTYNEMTLTDHELMVVGNPDLLFADQDGRIIVIEIKSTTTLAAEIESAQGNHILQSVLYRDLLRRMGYQVSPFILVFYVSKKFRWGSPYKEFWIDASNPTYENMTAQAWRFAETIKEGWQNTRTALPARVCNDHRCTRAKACPVVTNCFAME